MGGRYQAWPEGALGLSIMLAHAHVLQGRESLHFDRVSWLLSEQTWVFTEPESLEESSVVDGRLVSRYSLPLSEARASTSVGYETAKSP